tara:strand:+ start:27 stop:491 length:465 start_codon:yes stop_codon:yes gene_type:complete
MAKPITVKQVLKATRKFLDEGRLAAQNRKLKAGGQCRYAYADDPKGFGYHRCALGAAMTKGQLDFLREQGDGGGSQLALGNSLAAIWDHARQEIPFDVDDAGEDALVDLKTSTTRGFAERLPRRTSSRPCPSSRRSTTCENRPHPTDPSNPTRH